MIFTCVLFGFIGFVSLLGFFRTLKSRKWLFVEATIVNKRFVEFPTENNTLARIVATVSYDFDGMSYEKDIELGLTGVTRKGAPAQTDSNVSKHLIQVNPKDPAQIASSNPPL